MVVSRHDCQARLESKASVTATIRRARADDLAALVPLVEQYLAFYDVKHPRSAVTRFVAQRLRAKPAFVWVAAQSRAATAELIGFVQVYPSWSTLRLGPSWVLNDLYVEKQARGAGLGRALVKIVVAEAERGGVRSVELMTATTNAGARALYESLGFQTDSTFLTYSIALP